MLNAVSEMKKKYRAKHKVKKEKFIWQKKWFSFFINFPPFILCRFIASEENYGEILFISKAVSVFVCWGESRKKRENFMSRRCSLLMGCIFLFPMFFPHFMIHLGFFFFLLSVNTVSCSHTTLTRKYTPLQYH